MDTAPLRRTVADEVRAELARQRRTAKDMAAEVGIPHTTLHRRLMGSSPFNLDELEAVSRWLGVPASSLMVRPERVVAS